MTTKYIRAAGGNSSSATTYELTPGGGETTTVPTNADTVIGHAASGNFVVDAALTCQGLDLNAYTKTVSGSASISISSLTAPAGNVALRISAATTWTFTGSISFGHTVATTLSITSNGKTLGGAVNFTGSGGSWQLADNLTITGTCTLTAGTLDLNSKNVSCTQFSTSGSGVKNLTASSANIMVSSNGNAFTISGTNLSIDLSSATITMTSTSGNHNLTINGSTIGTVVDSGGGTFSLFGSGNTINTLNITGTAIKTFQFILYGDNAIGSATINGNSAINRVLITPDTIGTTRTLTVGTWSSISNVDFRDIAAAGTANWNLSAITGGSGDCGGNSGITFTSPITQTWQVYNVGTQWSAAGNWPTRVPLPQDSVRFNGGTFVSAVTIAVDMPRAAKNIDFTGAIWTGTALNVSKSIAFTFYGDLILADGMTHSNAVAITADWREPHRIYMANTAIPAGIIFSLPIKQITNAGAAMQRIGFNGGLAG